MIAKKNKTRDLIYMLMFLLGFCDILFGSIMIAVNCVNYKGLIGLGLIFAGLTLFSIVRLLKKLRSNVDMVERYY